LLAFGVLASVGVLHEYQVLDDRRADEARLLARARRSIDARNGGEAVPSAPLKEGRSSRPWLRPACSGGTGAAC
jgi:hypothetical protein